VTTIFGRTQERRATLDFLVSVRVGPRALLLEGEPGIGKTTLWQEAIECAARYRLLRVCVSRASERETQLSFTALTDLFDGILDRVLGALPTLDTPWVCVSPSSIRFASTLGWEPLFAPAGHCVKQATHVAGRRAVSRCHYPLAEGSEAAAYSADSSICRFRNRRSVSVTARSAARSNAVRAASVRPSRRNIEPRAACMR
jgi:hypothetical protein